MMMPTFIPIFVFAADHNFVALRLNFDLFRTKAGHVHVAEYNFSLLYFFTFSVNFNYLIFILFFDIFLLTDLPLLVPFC
jgi:hypothetical protein